MHENLRCQREAHGDQAPGKAGQVVHCDLTWCSRQLGNRTRFKEVGTEETQVKSLVSGLSGNANVCNYSIHVPVDIVPPQALMPMLEFHRKTQLNVRHRNSAFLPEF